MKKLLMLALLVSSTPSLAGHMVVDVPDASKLLWQVDASGNIWFRNLKTFRGDIPGADCCYSIKLDATTQPGMLLWSTLMSRISDKKKVSLIIHGDGAASNSNVYTVSHVGRHSPGGLE